MLALLTEISAVLLDVFGGYKSEMIMLKGGKSRGRFQKDSGSESHPCGLGLVYYVILYST